MEYWEGTTCARTCTRAGGTDTDSLSCRQNLDILFVDIVRRFHRALRGILLVGDAVFVHLVLGAELLAHEEELLAEPVGDVEMGELLDQGAAVGRIVRSLHGNFLEHGSHDHAILGDAIRLRLTLRPPGSQLVLRDPLAGDGSLDDGAVGEHGELLGEGRQSKVLEVVILGVAEARVVRRVRGTGSAHLPARITDAAVTARLPGLRRPCFPRSLGALVLGRGNRLHLVLGLILRHGDISFNSA
jgi:hypothetical protein